MHFGSGWSGVLVTRLFLVVASYGVEAGGNISILLYLLVKLFYRDLDIPIWYLFARSPARNAIRTRKIRKNISYRALNNICGLDGYYTFVTYSGALSLSSIMQLSLE